MNRLNHYIIPNCPLPNSVRAYSTTRIKGHSKTPFHAFNLSFNVGDHDEAVKKNRQQLMDELEMPESPVWLKQVHGNHVITLNDNISEPCADASFTMRSNKICVVTTADCLPILLWNQEGTEVAAIHAGWRGLLTDVIGATIQAMTSSPDTLIAWLGPAIGPNVFELNEEIRVDFLNSNPQNIDCFEVRNENKIFANIYKMASHNLNRYGVKNIYGGNYCTYTQNDLFYSFRRDSRVTGRMASLIWITS